MCSFAQAFASGTEGHPIARCCTDDSLATTARWCQLSLFTTPLAPGACPVGEARCVPAWTRRIPRQTPSEDLYPYSCSLRDSGSDRAQRRFYGWRPHPTTSGTHRKYRVKVHPRVLSDWTRYAARRLCIKHERCQVVPRATREDVMTSNCWDGRCQGESLPLGRQVAGGSEDLLATTILAVREQICHHVSASRQHEPDDRATKKVSRTRLV